MCKWNIKNGIFPRLECANVRPIYKRVDPFDKKNYRPVSILPLLSKVHERVIYEQASNYFEPFFNEILCGFRKAYRTEHPSFELLISWQTSLSRGGFVDSILMDFSKAYDCLNNDVLLAQEGNVSIHFQPCSRWELWESAKRFPASFLQHFLTFSFNPFFRQL